VTFTEGTSAYAHHVGRYGPALSSVHVDAAGIARGDSALDVGCGPGVLLAELARRLGLERVAGVDPSPPFVDRARAAVPGADVRSAAVEELPFESDSFDVVLSQLVVNFMSDAHAGVAEMDRGSVVAHVALAEVACHAGGRGFESRRSRTCGSPPPRPWP
jgi:SAM-dependent methyltransferase